jgi:hypothetical protein
MGPLGATDAALPPWEIDWSGLTHVILFDNGNISQTPPYWAYAFGPPPLRPLDTESDSISVEFNGVASPGDGGGWPHYLDSLVTIAHRHGVKVLATIQAVNPLNLNYVAQDSSRAQVLIEAAVEWAERKHFDGIELDWEGWAAPLPEPEIVNRFVRMLYHRVHRMKTDGGAPGLITISAGSGQNDLYDPAQDYMVDQFNLQLYDYSYAWYGKLNANAAWYLAPLHRGAVDPTFEGEAYDTRGPLQWVDAGHDRKHLGMGVPLFGSILRNVDSLFQPMDWSGDYGLAHYQVIDDLKSIGGVEEWDDVRKVRSIRGTARRSNGREVYYQSDGVDAGQKFFATGENPRSLQEKINWMIRWGFGGIMTYDLAADLDPTQPIGSGKRNPLKHAVDAALNPPVVTPPTAATGVEAQVLPECRLEQNYPNPFNPETRIRFSVAARERVRLTVYDMLGRTAAVLADDVLEAGWHEARWNASGVSSGVYLCRLTTGAYTAAKLMIFMK